MRIVFAGKYPCLWCKINHELMQVSCHKRGHAEKQSLENFQEDYDRFVADGSLTIDISFITMQGVKLRLIQAPMRLNFSLWRPNPES